MAQPSWFTIPGVRGFLGLSRRVRALLAALVVFLVLFILAITMPVPYVELSPGPTFNTLGTDGQGNAIIVIKGHAANDTSGHLNMTTVDVSTAPMTAFDAIVGWLAHDKVVVPKASVYPPGQTEQQTNQQNTQEFAASQDSATEAAACQLGYPKAFGVLDVTAGGPAAGRLALGDQLISVDGKPTGNYSQLSSVMQAETPGKSVPVVVKRGGTQQTITVTLGQPPAKKKGAGLGISVPQGQACLLPFAVDLGLGNQIGGPSAGLMFALGIMDKVGSVDLTHGKFIAGTGTIDPDGNVGPIGGIQLKMIAARKAGATVFLAPAGNCTDVRGATPAGLDVVKVSKLSEAVADLKSLNAGQPVPHC
jgi:PDZ domain-containing protein